MRGLFPRLDEMSIPFSVRVMFEILFVLFHINRIHCILLCARYCVKDLHVLSMYPDDNFINYMPSSYTLQLRILTWTNILNLLQFDFSQCLVYPEAIGFCIQKDTPFDLNGGSSQFLCLLKSQFPCQKNGDDEVEDTGQLQGLK